ncbi:DUF1616 domain-containing protein [Natrialba taiwanensis]|uniref:DUF1616 domain-containing protein n=1 Tax=Natrialba taiwanensis DSM 12281 TaxID=1230458 RepID=L9ZEE3_9EURY|nr:DUF1616 domain-containing protein [Natrialba taiwanensis]ELY84855.1 hypothetical protein C484_21948 [Natrialba taiwanensis DSM 12281]
MSLRTSTQTRLGSVRRYPGDLAIVSLVAIGAYVAVTSVADETALRLLAALPLVLFVPGYALVSVLFPAGERDARETTATAVDAETYPRGIDVVERLGLALAVSVAVVPLLALGLAVTEWGLGTVSTAAALCVFTVVVAQIGVIRRLRVPEAKRFRVAPIAALAGFRQGESGAVTVTSLLLGVAIVVAAGALLVGLIAPVSSGGFSQLALYTENESGDLVTGGIQDEVAPGESVPVTVEMENQAGEEMTYTAVVQQQTLEDDAVVDRTELDTISATVTDGSSVQEELEVTPTAESGETVRISVLLYEDEPPSEPTAEDALAETTFWVTVTEDAGA